MVYNIRIYNNIFFILYVCINILVQICQENLVLLYAKFSSIEALIHIFKKMEYNSQTNRYIYRLPVFFLPSCPLKWIYVHCRSLSTCIAAHISVTDAPQHTIVYTKLSISD